MSYYFNLEELRQKMSDSRFFSRRFETMLTFKLNSLKGEALVYSDLFHQRAYHQRVAPLA